MNTYPNVMKLARYLRYVCVTEYNKLLTKMSDKKMGPPFSYILCALTSNKTNTITKAKLLSSGIQ